ncbi:Uncharacterised protein [Mycobacteroides abscessus subsp. abscessus]|nr:Uncharacterised protein [Mycobacteroides abscessus subsp. abscessus]
MLIRAVGGMLGDDADLIQRQPAFPHRLGAAREFLDPVRNRHHHFRIAR